jgi:hypothetical protein
VVGVKDDWDSVRRSDTADVMGTSDTTGNGSFLVAIGDSLCIVSKLNIELLAFKKMYLSSKVGSTTL